MKQGTAREGGIHFNVCDVVVITYMTFRIMLCVPFYKMPFTTGDAGDTPESW